MFPFTQIGKALSTIRLGWDRKQYPTPSTPPDREDRLTEKLASAPIQIPAFLPYFDPQQAVGETETMRFAYRVMMADPNVKAAFLGKVIGVMGLELKMHSASDKAREKEHADFCEWNIKRRLSGGVPGLAWTILSGAGIDGYSISEPVWAIQDEHRFRLKRVVRELKAKDVNVDLVPWIDRYKNIIAIQGLRWNEGQYWSPKEFIIYRHLPLYDTPTGMSDLRAAYGSYWILDTVTKLRAMGAEKRAFPLIWAKCLQQAKQAATESIIAKLRYQNWLVVPPDVEMQVMDIAGSSADYFEKFTATLREQIFLSIQGATLQSITGGAGQTRGSSLVHKDTADLFKWYLSAALCECLNNHETGLIPAMLEGNFRDINDYPYATLTGVDEAELAESLKIDQGLQALGWRLDKKEMKERYGRKFAESDEDAVISPQEQLLAQGGGDEEGKDGKKRIPYVGPTGAVGKKNPATGDVDYHSEDKVDILTVKPKRDFIAHAEAVVDEGLWEECKRLIPLEKPTSLPVIIGKILGRYTVVLVDGDKVKVEHDADFVEGNNFKESPKFIPEGEVWLDDGMEIDQLAYILYHECHETRDMEGGMSYADAHKKANDGEMALRKRDLQAASIFAEKVRTLAMNLDAPDLKSARIQVKHLLNLANPKEQIHNLLKKLSPVDRESLAREYGMETGRRIFKPAEIAERIVG